MSGNYNGIAVLKNITFVEDMPATGILDTDGQLIIGASTAPYGRAALPTSSDGSITFTFGPGTIDMSVTNQGLTWSDQGSSTTVSSNTGSFSTAAITLTLPASPSNGATIAFCASTADALQIQANTGQYIRNGSGLSTIAGTATSNAIGDSITLVYQSSTTTWTAIGASQGIWTLA